MGRLAARADWIAGKTCACRIRAKLGLSAQKGPANAQRYHARNAEGEVSATRGQVTAPGPSERDEP